MMSIFKSKRKPAIQAQRDEENLSQSPIKSIKPKVLLVDLEEKTLDAVHAAGINATAGTLGRPYKVELSTRIEPMPDSGQLTRYEEMEIIFVDLNYDTLAEFGGEITTPPDALGIWVARDRGFIDPRAKAAISVREGFDRIVAAGGIVVVFASSPSQMKIQYGQMSGNRFWPNKDLQISEWSFLSELDSITVSTSDGEEIRLCKTHTAFDRVLSEFLPESRFKCLVETQYRNDITWTPLAKNKFGQPVGLSKIFESGGAVFVLPQIGDKTGFIKSLLTDVFPEMFPSLFPESSKGLWTHRPEYELTPVLALNTEREQLIEKHEAQLKSINAQIETARDAGGWLHDLLTQTGDPLVEAIKIGLGELGFVKVVDMDVIRDRDNKTRREDLQILDAGPTLIVDVKGLSNFPADEDALQAGKHATLVMREQKRTDVFGLAIINHQRHLPPLQRDNAMPFRQELIDIALETQQGLMTSWDFYRLVINAQRHSWRPDVVKPVLYRHGRIDPIPNHYALLGRVSQVWTNAFGVDIEHGSVSVGDTVALEFNIYFEETLVLSIQVEDEHKEQATVGEKTGIPWTNTFGRPKFGMRVFVAKNPPARTIDATNQPVSSL